MSNFNFTRQILVFIAIWGLLIYIFITKLGATSAKDDGNAELHRLNQALEHLERSKAIDIDLKRLIDEYANDISNVDSKVELLKKINSKFQESGEAAVLSKDAAGSPSFEYEQSRKRVGSNIQELWNFIFAEAQKIEKLMKSEADPQQSLKELTSFVQLAVEQKRYELLSIH